MNRFHEFANGNGILYGRDYHCLGTSFDEGESCLPEEKHLELKPLYEAWVKPLAEIFP